MTYNQFRGPRTAKGLEGPLGHYLQLTLGIIELLMRRKKKVLDVVMYFRVVLLRGPKHLIYLKGFDCKKNNFGKP